MNPTSAYTSGARPRVGRPETALPRGLAAGPKTPQLRSLGWHPQRQATRACLPGFREQPPANRLAPHCGYLFRSREAALRQTSRKQKSGYWRQISRPRSSRSRCFSFSPIVRTQGTISGVTVKLCCRLRLRSRRPPLTSRVSDTADSQSRRQADGLPAADA